MNKPSGNTYCCDNSPNLVSVDLSHWFARVFLAVELDGINGAIALTPDDARSLARDLKRATKILEKG